MKKYKMTELCNFHNSMRLKISYKKLDNGIYPLYGSTTIKKYIDHYIFDGDYILMTAVGNVLTKDNKPKLKLVSGKFAANNKIHVFSIKDENILLRKYLYYLLSNMDFNSMVSGNPPVITGVDLKNLEIKIPSIKKQKQIVEKIDVYFDNKNKRLNQLENIKNIRNKIINDRNNCISLKSVCDIVGGIALSSKTHTITNNTNNYILGVGDISSGIINITKDTVETTGLTLSNNKNMLIKKDNILIPRFNSNKLVTLVDEDIDAICYSNVAKLVPNKKVCPKFLKYVLESDFVRNQFRTTSNNITNEDLFNLKIPKYNLKEQEEIVKTLETVDELKFKLINEIDLRDIEMNYKIGEEISIHG